MSRKPSKTRFYWAFLILLRKRMETKYPFVCGKLWEGARGGGGHDTRRFSGSVPGWWWFTCANKSPPATAQQAGDRGRAPTSVFRLRGRGVCAWTVHWRLGKRFQVLRSQPRRRLGRGCIRSLDRREKSGCILRGFAAGESSAPWPPMAAAER